MSDNELDVLLSDEKKNEGKEGKEEMKFKPGCSCDVGTANIVVTRQTEDNTFVNRFHRNMLYPMDISDEAADLLERSSYFYIKVDGKYFVVGEDALSLIRAIGRGEVIRPMKDGILNPNLQSSSELLFYIIKVVLGEPIIKNEPLRFSCPANPIDRDLDNTFHKMILQSFFTKLGYDAKPTNEAMAIAYCENPVLKSEGKDVPLSGISISCGSGMWNISLCFKGLSLNEFSCTRSGDFLDGQVSKATGVPVSKVIRIKEKEMDLNNVNMSDRVQAALSIYVDEMLERMVHHICTQFKEKSSEMEGEVEVVVAGGTSLLPNFCGRLEQVIKRSDMPFKIYRIRHAQNPFYSVSNGLCIRAQADYAKANKK